MERLYTTEQAAKLLQVSVITIRRYIKSGKLRASKIGKDYRI
ncbi:helix-turn-helix domain-containing protein, partial [Patescibacteria group bacterium]|nr:helix-turn-helix domain-containing protein [Patescibacteria group bacterium]